MKLSISPGNSKIGKTPSVSLPPLITCPAGSPCMKDCYANNHAYRLYPSVRKAWDNNLAIWEDDPDIYQWQIREYLANNKVQFFRWHVGGDMPDEPYAEMVENLAYLFIDKVQFLIYTRRDWLDTSTWTNLSVIRSQWPGEKVYTNRRKFIVLPKGEPVPTGRVLCPGNCEGCRECWISFRTDPIYIHKH